jgi:hypothetical protein
MALTLTQLQDYINTNVKKNGRNAITGDQMNYLMLNFVDWVSSNTALPDKATNALKFLRVNVAETAYEWAALPCHIQLAASDETTALTAGNGKISFRMPHGMNLTEVRASLGTAQTSGSIFTVDINQNGTSVLSTKITIDNTEKTSKTAATAAVISNASLTDDAEITVDIDQIGDGTAKGLKLTLIGTF